MGSKGLKLNPTHICENMWYYEEPKGICIIIKTHDCKTELLEHYISWAKIKKMLERKLNNKA